MFCLRKYLAFDIGGTAIKYGVVDDSGQIHLHDAMDTEAYLGGPSIIQKVIQKGKELLQHRKNIVGIAISSAGQIDVAKGKVIGAGETIPHYKGIEIKQLIEEALNLPVEVQNDVNSAALCEQWLGGHDTENFLTLTIGTGVGGAIILQNELYTGHTYSAGEWGYMNIEGEPFEKVASVTGLIDMMTEEVGDHHLNGEMIFAKYEQGHPAAQKAVKRFYKHLGIGISNLLYIFNPEKVVIGGGISKRGNKFLQEVQEAVKEHTAENIYNNSEIVLAKHANHSGMLGAVYHFMNKQSK